MKLLASATDNCVGDTKSGEVLITSTPQATKHSPLPSAAFSAEDQKCTMTGLLWSKQENWRTLLGSRVPAPARALLDRSSQRKGNVNCSEFLLPWDLAEVHPSLSSWVCIPLSGGRNVRASKPSTFGWGQKGVGETFPDNLAAVLWPYSRSNVRSGVLALSV